MSKVTKAKWNQGRLHGRTRKLHKARRRRERRRHVERGAPRVRAQTHPQYPQPARGQVIRNVVTYPDKGRCGRPRCQHEAESSLHFEHYHRGRWKVASPRRRCKSHAKRFLSKHA